jgi:hypothetical protein
MMSKTNKNKNMRLLVDETAMKVLFEEYVISNGSVTSERRTILF